MQCTCSVMAHMQSVCNVMVAQYTYEVCMQCNGWFSMRIQCVCSVMGGSVHVCSVHAV